MTAPKNLVSRHYVAAVELFDTVAEIWDEEPGPAKVADIIAGAQVQATLALVEQQRIANRIAISALVAEDQRFYGQYGVSGNLTGPQGVFTLDSEGNAVLNEDIREGLG